MTPGMYLQCIFAAFGAGVLVGVLIVLTFAC